MRKALIGAFLTLVLTGCSEQGWIGVTRTDGGITILSGCTDIGIHSLAIGPDTGITEGGGVHPVLTTVELEATWRGPEEKGPNVIHLDGLDPDFYFEGPRPDPYSDEAILIKVRFPPSLVVGTTERVVPSELQEGLIQVPSKSRGTEFESVTRAEFDSRTSNCAEPPVLLAIVGTISTLGFVALFATVVYRNTELAHRRKLQGIPPPSASPPPPSAPPPVPCGPIH